MLKRLIKRYILKPKLRQEVFDAYFHKLPENIEVKWFRDEGYIVGAIDTNGGKCFTQGKNAEDFINMVNDAVFTAYDIPEDYTDAISALRAYKPPEDEMNKLRDKKVKNSILGFIKNKEALKIA